MSLSKKFNNLYFLLKKFSQSSTIMHLKNEIIKTKGKYKYPEPKWLSCRPLRIGPYIQIDIIIEGSVIMTFEFGFRTNVTGRVMIESKVIHTTWNIRSHNCIINT